MMSCLRVSSSGSGFAGVTGVATAAAGAAGVGVGWAVLGFAVVVAFGAGKTAAGAL